MPSKLFYLSFGLMVLSTLCFGVVLCSWVLSMLSSSPAATRQTLADLLPFLVIFTLFLLSGATFVIYLTHMRRHSRCCRRQKEENKDETGTKAEEMGVGSTTSSPDRTTSPTLSSDDMEEDSLQLSSSAEESVSSTSVQ